MNKRPNKKEFAEAEGKWAIPVPRELTRDDFLAAAVYAKSWPSDPYAYGRALSRLRYYFEVDTP